MKIFACFVKKSRLLFPARALALRGLTIVSKLGGGVDDSVLWLSFAQQKLGRQVRWTLLFQIEQDTIFPYGLNNTVQDSPESPCKHGVLKRYCIRREG
jgi:hypothetical protein